MRRYKKSEIVKAGFRHGEWYGLFYPPDYWSDHMGYSPAEIKAYTDAYTRGKKQRVKFDLEGEL